MQGGKKLASSDAVETVLARFKTFESGLNVAAKQLGLIRRTEDGRIEFPNGEDFSGGHYPSW